MKNTILFIVLILQILSTYLWLQKYGCEILGFSTKNPRGENTFAPKRTLLVPKSLMSGL